MKVFDESSQKCAAQENKDDNETEDDDNEDGEGYDQDGDDFSGDENNDVPEANGEEGSEEDDDEDEPEANGEEVRNKMTMRKTMKRMRRRRN